MATLTEYRADIERGERGEFRDAEPGATAAMFGVMAHQIRGALWQPSYQEEAMALADRAQRLARTLPRD